MCDNPRGDEQQGMRVMMRENDVDDLPIFIKKMYFQLMLLALLQVQLNLDHMNMIDKVVSSLSGKVLF